MKKTFVYILFTLLVLNFLHKGIRYFMYDKVTGVVVAIEEHSSIAYKVKSVYFTNLKAPVIEYSINGYNYKGSLEKWTGLYLPSQGEKVTLMYDKNPASPELNRFFQYWLTLRAVLKIFGVSMVAIVLIQCFKSYRNGEFQNRKTP